MSAVKHLLQGRPFRSPLHPALVHLPIALFPVSLLLDLGSWMCPWRDLYLTRGAFVTLVGGLATALLAAVFGLADFASIRRDHPARAVAIQHLVLNVVALLLFAVSAVFRYPFLDAATTGGIPLALSVAGVAILAYSGYLGGHLVYSDGVGVGRHRRDTDLPRATITLQAHGMSMVPVGDDDMVPEGVSLRLSIDGTVIALARLGGQLYAFQEFCPHRYGPLSEGELKDCTVTCPWHQSQFDLRTGAVTSGPAKVPLRTFRVEVREHIVWVEAPRPRA